MPLPQTGLIHLKHPLEATRMQKSLALSIHLTPVPVIVSTDLHLMHSIIRTQSRFR